MNVDSVDDVALSQYPGGELVAMGLADLKRGVSSEAALLVLIAGRRLRDLGLPVPVVPATRLPREHQLFQTVEERNPAGAHAEYNALIGRLVAFANAYDSVKSRS